MKIASTGNLDAAAAAARPAEGTAARAPARAAAPAAAGPGPSQSAATAAAREALRAMPDVDLARVAQLRDALARGEAPFDADKLAALVLRFHGGRA